MGRRIKKWLSSLGVFLACFIILEIIFTSLHYAGYFAPLPIWFIVGLEDGKNYTFDPIQGYKIPTDPTTIGCYLTNGHLESMGEIKGNNYGFPDDRDFTAHESDSSKLRIAVFGDSYTASQFTRTTWVEELESMIDPKMEQDIQFMNFAIDGGGLANWWSIITRLLDAEDFDFDGAIFCVFGDDLMRPFHSRDSGIYADFYPDNPEGKIRNCYSYSATHNPATFATRAEEQDCFFPDRFIVIDDAVLDKIIAGKDYPKRQFYGKVQPFLSTAAVQIVRHAIRYQHQKYKPEPDDAEATGEGRPRLLANAADTSTPYLDEEVFTEEYYMLQLMHDISDYLEREQLPTLTIGYYPHKEIVSFLDITGSEFFDASTAQNGKLHKDKLKKHKIRFDGHWTQNGVLNFANHIHEPVQEWLENNFQETRTESYEE